MEQLFSNQQRTKLILQNVSLFRFLGRGIFQYKILSYDCNSKCLDIFKNVLRYFYMFILGYLHIVGLETW
jgi:hypothetical protein